MTTILPWQRPANALAWHLTAAATYGVSAEGTAGVATAPATEKPRSGI